MLRLIEFVFANTTRMFSVFLAFIFTLVMLGIALWEHSYVPLLAWALGILNLLLVTIVVER